MKFFFFVLFYVILGTTSISIPILIKGFIPSEVSIGLVTIVMSTVGYNAVEKIMQLADESKDKKKTQVFICLVSLVIAFLATTYVCIKVSNETTIYVSIIVYLLSCVFWWFYNWNNKNLETSSQSTLGGSVEQFKK